MWSRGREASFRETGSGWAVCSWDGAGPELAVTLGVDRRH